MQRTQIYLSEQERQGLQALALRSGCSQCAINRRAAWRGCVRAGACGPIVKTCPAGLSLARARPPALLVVDTDVLIDDLRDQADAVMRCHWNERLPCMRDCGGAITVPAMAPAGPMR